MTLYLGNELVANSVTVPYNWSGTKAQYEALETINPEWVYYIIDDFTTTDILSVLYPVGALYITTANTCPLSTLMPNTVWQLVAEDRVLQGAGTRGTVGTTVDESLPNITGTFTADNRDGSPYHNDSTGSITDTYTSQSWGFSGGAAYTSSREYTIDASNSSSTYQDDAPVQPDAYLVNIYRRIS